MPSLLPDARRPPSRLNERHFTGPLCPANDRSNLPSCTCQRLILPVASPHARITPSGVNASDSPRLIGPSNSRVTACRSSTVRNEIGAPSQQVASCFPSGESRRQVNKYLPENGTGINPVSPLFRLQTPPDPKRTAGNPNTATRPRLVLKDALVALKRLSPTVILDSPNGFKERIDCALCAVPKPHLAPPVHRCQSGAVRTERDRIDADRGDMQHCEWVRGPRAPNTN